MPLPQSVRSKIANNILDRLALIPQIKYRAFDVVRLASSDFQDYELPAVQILDLAELTFHEMRRAKKEWNIVLEVILGPTMEMTVSQQNLWDLMQEIERTIWAEPNLGISEVVHCRLMTSSTDLHIMKPFYLGRIELQVIYYQPLVGEC